MIKCAENCLNKFNTIFKFSILLNLFDFVYENLTTKWKLNLLSTWVPLAHYIQRSNENVWKLLFIPIKKVDLDFRQSNHTRSPMHIDIICIAHNILFSRSYSRSFAHTMFCKFATIPRKHNQIMCYTFNSTVEVIWHCCCAVLFVVCFSQNQAAIWHVRSAVTFQTIT